MSKVDLDVSVVIVIDYKVGKDDWSELRLTLSALAHQDFEGVAEFLLVRPHGATGPEPEALRRILPGLRLVEAEGRTSYDMKNAGCREAASDLVVILDADCVPVTGWLSAAVRHHRRHPEAAAISGKTLYREDRLLHRIFALLDRSYVEGSGDGTSGAISNNNAAFRREIMLQHPLRNDLGTFGSKIHSETILAAGEALRFEPAMVVRHRFNGWAMQRADRRHIGYAMARHREASPGARHGWMFRLGLAGLPLIYGMSVAGSLKRCLKHRRSYGVRWFELPAAAAVALAVHGMEMPGLVVAMRDGEIAYGEGYV